MQSPMCVHEAINYYTKYDTATHIPDVFHLNFI